MKSYTDLEQSKRLAEILPLESAEIAKAWCKLDNNDLSNDDLKTLFPELKESEDEKIRRALIKFIEKIPYERLENDGVSVKDALAWLEKQGNEPNWCHHQIGVTKVDLSGCSEEYRKAYYDGWNNCNQQHSQCKSEWNDVVKCLINGMKYYYEDNEEATWGTEKFSMKVKDILSWLEKQYADPIKEYWRGYNESKQNVLDKYAELEKQGKQENAERPKFKVGDWIVDNCGNVWKIKEILNQFYILEDTEGDESHPTIEWVNKTFHLLTIQDVRNGDILAYETDEEDLWIMIYWSLYEPYEGHVHYHALLVNDNFYDKGTCCICIDNLKPATKEQRDLLFQKMKESGYEWDAEKKKLLSKPIKYNSNPPSIDKKSDWSEEDDWIKTKMDEKQSKLCEKCMNAPINSKERVQILTECRSQSCWYKGY